MWRLGFMRRYTCIMVYPVKPPRPLPVPPTEPPDVLLLQRTIQSLEQENAWLKECLAQSLTTLEHHPDRLSTALKEKAEWRNKNRRVSCFDRTPSKVFP
jgi:hypothetical protein